MLDRKQSSNPTGSTPAPAPLAPSDPGIQDEGRSVREQPTLVVSPPQPSLNFKSRLPHEEPLSPRQVQAAFPSDYFSSRARFLTQAQGLEAEITTREIRARGPNGETLSIDIALIGSRNPKRVILHLAGVHGVEGFVGSAIQSEIMRAGPRVDQATALVLVHCLNPYGMAHLRRTTVDNVDLNRNFIPDGERWGGTPRGYELLAPLLNPYRINFPLAFYPLVARQIFEHGFSNLKEALLRGQYDQPRGLFFGGTQREEETEVLRAYIGNRLTGVEQVFGIDVHSGMGSYGKQTLFIDHERQRIRFSYLEHALEHALVPPPPDYHAIGKRTRGAICDEVPKLFTKARVDWVLQEFGTFHAIRVLAALRQENQRFHFGDPGEWRRGAEGFRRTFVPDDLRWRTSIVSMGTELVAKAIRAFEK